MTLSPGTRLGPYEIQAAIGAGGMGEVYKAKDTRLDRSVAIKVLPPEFSADPDRRTRFEREAKTIAGLNHPHICTLHDVGHDVPTEQAGRRLGSPKPVGEGGGAEDDPGDSPQGAPVDYLVMELLVGETLAERLGKGPLPLDQALTVATEIADALAAAHRQGVIHRDLKPGNVMLTKAGAKLLDFGLAKLTGHGDRPAAASLASAPTATRPLTSEGAIVGTLQYMAPEQVEGKPADARTDLWALGAIAYEMLTGKRAFEGASAASLIGNIMNSQPAALATVQPLTPPALDRLVRKCLEKDPDRRWQSSADVADELRWLATGSAATGEAPGVEMHPVVERRVRYWIMVPVVLAILALGMFGGMWLPSFFTSPADPSVLHLAIPASSWGLSGIWDLAVSPDGRTVVFGAADDAGAWRLYSYQILGRDLRSSPPKPLEGTEMAAYPFFSPDGQHIAFRQAGESLWRVPVSGGKLQRICDFPDFVGGVWKPDGKIVLGGSYRNPGLWEVAAGGGPPRALYTPRPHADVFYRFPDVLPDGSIVYTTYEQGRSALRVWSEKGGERVLHANVGRARYVAPGYLVYSYGASLRVQPFDVAMLENRASDVAAAPFETIADLPVESIVASAWALSDSGTLVSLPDYPAGASLAWRDRRGAVTPLPHKPRQYGGVSLSRDGRRFVTDCLEREGRRIFMGNVEGETLEPLTEGPDDVFQRFTPDGKWVAFSRNAGGQYDIFRIAADMSGRLEQLDDRPEPDGQPELNRAGTTVLFNSPDASKAMHIWRKSLPSGLAQPFITAPGQKQITPRFSPDERWVAYLAQDGTSRDVYIQQFPTGVRVRVSTEGAVNGLAWNSKGGELFYLSGGAMMAATIADGRIVKKERLFGNPGSEGTGDGTRVLAFDVHPDGDRFLVVQAAPSARYPPQILVTLNWMQALRPAKSD